MTPERIKLSVAEARDLAEGALRGIGYDADEARIVAGSSSGLGALSQSLNDPRIMQFALKYNF